MSAALNQAERGVLARAGGNGQISDQLARREAAVEAQSRFVANASHELRNRLAVGRTLLEVALADPDATAQELRATCQELLADADDHARLLESLLTLASSNRGLAHREPLDLSTLARDALRKRSAEIEHERLKLVATLAPAATVGDAVLIERLIANLIDNATHYNHTGGNVEIQTGTDTGHSRLSVTNSGPVIPTHELERLFEAFQQLHPHNLTRCRRHHGLGLSIVHAIATAHRATISVRARPRGGLSVTVSFVALHQSRAASPSHRPDAVPTIGTRPDSASRGNR